MNNNNIMNILTKYATDTYLKKALNKGDRVKTTAHYQADRITDIDRILEAIDLIKEVLRITQVDDSIGTCNALTDLAIRLVDDSVTAQDDEFLDLWLLTK